MPRSINPVNENTQNTAVGYFNRSTLGRLFIVSLGIIILSLASSSSGLFGVIAAALLPVATILGCIYFSVAVLGGDGPALRLFNFACSNLLSWSGSLLSGLSRWMESAPATVRIEELPAAGGGRARAPLPGAEADFQDEAKPLRFGAKPLKEKSTKPGHHVHVHLYVDPKDFKDSPEPEKKAVKPNC